jgi:hypothetical protein
MLQEHRTDQDMRCHPYFQPNSAPDSVVNSSLQILPALPQTNHLQVHGPGRIDDADVSEQAVEVQYVSARQVRRHRVQHVRQLDVRVVEAHLVGPEASTVPAWGTHRITQNV